jgi:hypothetical protein
MICHILFSGRQSVACVIQLEERGLARGSGSGDLLLAALDLRLRRRRSRQQVEPLVTAYNIPALQLDVAPAAAVVISSLDFPSFSTVFLHCV